MKKLYTAKSKIAGRGVFAGEDIKNGEFVLLMTGKTIHKVYRTESDLNVGKTWVCIGVHKWMAPDFPVKFMNHSCDANLAYKTPRRIYARRDIKKDEELTIDYSIIEYVDFWRLPCTCGSKLCRKEMRSIQFLPLSLYKSYLPYIPRFLQKIYLQYNGVKYTKTN